MHNLLPHLCLSLIFVLHVHISRTEQICDKTSCGGIEIQFPFALKGSNNNKNQVVGSCNYPRFQLSCDSNSNTFLSLPNSGDLVVKSINYVDQTIKVNDPSGCLPKRFLQNLSFSGSPFTINDAVYGFYNLTFLSCSSNVTDSYPLPPISCLSDYRSHHMGNSESTSVIVSSHSWWEPRVSSSSLLSECEVMAWAFVPVPNVSLQFDLNSDIELMWKEPRCGDCAVRGQVCGFINNSSLQVQCFSSPNESQDLSRSAKYSITIGVIVTGLISTFGLCCLLSSQFKIRTRSHRPIIVLPNPAITEPGPLRTGLDGLTIEKFPKTIIGDSGLLPKPNDNTCLICLCEYEPKEALRTIPECNHYFHAQCIDEWLKLNATCPICRNSPEGSSYNLINTHFSPLSSSSMSISLSMSTLAQITQMAAHNNI